jgi:trehalose/maltose transport system permease protein
MTANAVMKSVVLCALVVMIALFSVFPFYYAIVTSFATGTGLFEIIYWPKQFSWANCEVALGRPNVSAQHPEFGVRRDIHSGLRVVFGLFLAVAASYTLKRMQFRERALFLITILGVWMFPQSECWPGCSS